MSKRLSQLQGHSVIFLKCSVLLSPPHRRPSFRTSSQTKWGWSWSDPEERQGWSSKWARDMGKLRRVHFPSSLLLLIPGPSQHIGLPSATWGSPGTLSHPHQVNLIIPYLLRAECQATCLSSRNLSDLVILRAGSEFHDFAFVFYRLWRLKGSAPHHANTPSFFDSGSV